MHTPEANETINDYPATICCKCKSASSELRARLAGWLYCPDCDPEPRFAPSVPCDPMDAYKRRAENSAMGLDEYGMDEVPWGHPERERF